MPRCIPSVAYFITWEHFAKNYLGIKEYCSKLPLTMGIKYEKINVKKDSASLADKEF